MDQPAAEQLEGAALEAAVRRRVFPRAGVDVDVHGQIVVDVAVDVVDVLSGPQGAAEKGFGRLAVGRSPGRQSLELCPPAGAGPMADRGAVHAEFRGDVLNASGRAAVQVPCLISHLCGLGVGRRPAAGGQQLPGTSARATDGVVAGFRPTLPPRFDEECPAAHGAVCEKVGGFDTPLARSVVAVADLTVGVATLAATINVEVLGQLQQTAA